MCLFRHLSNLYKIISKQLKSSCNPKTKSFMFFYLLKPSKIKDFFFSNLEIKVQEMKKSSVEYCERRERAQIFTFYSLSF